ncbi:MAG TPA: hypothetical protein VJ739_11110 [Gemmataceae bacterium]|nr:hypothetical protein [Gemmataceae bacterium]
MSEPLPDVTADLQAVAQRVARGVRDLEEARKAAANVDRIREENRRRFGEEATGVAIIREFRGPLPE